MTDIKREAIIKLGITAQQFDWLYYLLRKQLHNEKPKKAELLLPGRKPCVHCGRCCLEEVCPVGQIFTRTSTPPCPALVKDKKGKYWCGLVVCPWSAMYAKSKYAQHWSMVLGGFIDNTIFNFGVGCDRS